MQPTITKICKDEQPNEKNHKHINGSPKPRQRLIHVDKSIFNVSIYLWILYFIFDRKC